MTKIFLAFLFLSLVSLSAIDILLAPSAVHTATSGICLLQNQPSDSYVNPSLNSEGVEASASYLFGMKDIPVYNLHTGYFYKNVGISLGSQYINHPLYMENQLNLAIQYRFKHITIGVGNRLLYNKIENYGNDLSWLTDVGFFWQKHTLSSAFSFKNIFNSEYKGIALPQLFIFETAYKINKNASLAVQIEKENNFDYAVKFATNYKITEVLNIFCSYQSEPSEISAGLSVKVKQYSVHYGIRHHRYLDITHHVSLAFTFHNLNN
ncbi:MAG: hypothetical protein PHR06_08595 [Candidatus Cloacimonetes bacterium]|nr:hypothetical protein [Candidatus Cloacimonadota bacterium]